MRGKLKEEILPVLTRGNNYNIRCPHIDCGELNHYLMNRARVKVEYGKITYFKLPCDVCKKDMYIAAEYEITLRAEVNKDLL